jgi:hypothetical protein
MRRNRSSRSDQFTVSDPRSTITALSDSVDGRLKAAIDAGDQLTIVRAPPGSGKTFSLLRGVEHAAARRGRVAIGTQTNSQADDICERVSRDYPSLEVVRFAAAGRVPRALGPNITWLDSKKKLPHGPCVVIATIAKWSLTEIDDPYDILFVDEAWQMAWSDFMLCGQVAPRFVLIGDPGQIPPVVPIPVDRWETSPRAPHQPAPELILDDPGVDAIRLELPACRRLPYDSVDLVRPFYDFEFEAWARPGERFVEVSAGRNGRHRVDGALELLAEGSVAALTLATPPAGPPLELDAEIAVLAVETAVRLLEQNAIGHDDDSGGPAVLRPEDIGLAATHRVLNTAMYQALPTGLRGVVAVDTPERWQGLERKVMIVVHPLSGATAPSAFDLETGRLCVMTSRHRCGLIVVSRDHVRSTLETHIPFAEQAVGRPDVTGRGHEANLRFWERVEANGRVATA